jgi:uncharacterized membrane protein YbhN (UPF0104 family)
MNLYNIFLGYLAHLANYIAEAIYRQIIINYFCKKGQK